jgi:hypothetical protein
MLSSEGQAALSVEATVREILLILRLDGPATLSCGIALHDEGSCLFNSGSDEFAQTIEYIQAVTGEGPGFDVVAAGAALTLADLTADERWPVFAVAARLHGLVGLHAEPLCNREGAPIGTITWYSTRRGTFSDRLRRDLGTCARAVAVALGAVTRAKAEVAQT